MYLVDSRKCEHVSEISSVSGGSITNAFVAQRCDFHSVKPDDFDRIAAELARALTSGLLSKQLVIAIFGLSGAAMVVVAFITCFSWPFSLPLWLDVVLIALFVTLFGVLLLLRGTLLAYLLQWKLFSSPNLPTTLGDISSTVTHVFCATDLNACMPVYLTNFGMHFYSPAWGRAKAEKAAQIRVADAVRASAAFPGGIPPKQIDARGLQASLTPLQELRWWQQLVFREGREGREEPSMLYLADGGIWNNLGTDWFHPSTGLVLFGVAEWKTDVEQLLVVDASAPTAAQPQLKWFWLPYVAEILALLRVWLASYASTVNARVQDLESRANTVPPERPRPFVVRLIHPDLDLKRLGKLAWLGAPDHWSGRWSASLAIKHLLRARIPAKRCVVRNFVRLNDWSARVPTTLFSIPAEVAVQLLVHGYVSTAKTMAEPSKDAVAEPSEGKMKALAEFPGVGRFTKLLGLEAHPVPNMNVTFIGRNSDLKKYYDQMIAVNLNDILDEQIWTTHILACAGEVTKRQLEETNDVLAGAENHSRDLSLYLEEDAFVREPIRNAHCAIIDKDYASAVSFFSEAFSHVEISDESINAYDASQYAYALAQTTDTCAATEIATVAEKKAKAEALSSTDRKNVAAALWSTAAAYGLLGDAEGAVRCLRESLALWPGFRSRLSSPRESEDFQIIQNHSAFVAFKRQLVGASE